MSPAFEKCVHTNARAAVFAFAMLGLAVAARAATPNRIAGPVRGNRTTILHGSIHPRIHPRAGVAEDQGSLEPSVPLKEMRLILKPSDAQATELEQLLEDQRNPASADYQQWLTPQQFGERFGASENDIAAIAAWLESRGFVVGEPSLARNYISFSGTAERVATAFHTQIRRYRTGSETHFANATDISLPAEFSEMVVDVRGLNDFRPAPRPSADLRAVKPDFTSSNSSHYLAPDDLATIYNIAPLYTAGYDGKGQKLVIAGQTDINLSDIRGFRTQFGLPANDPQVIVNGSDPGVSQEDQIEATLDLEWSGAVARNATIIYVNSRNVFDSVQYAVDKNLAPVISLSYGACEIGSPASYRTMAQQANAQGITWLTSSGDSGAAGCDYGVKAATQGPTVSFPADIPEVTAVGGTEFTEAAGAGWNNRNGTTQASAIGYLPEKAWNDTANGTGLASTGGGVSKLFTKPWWQTGPGVPADNARDIPDVSLSASGSHDGYLIFSGGQLQTVGGTSASAPAFAGIVTLLNQYSVAKGTQPAAGMGNINPNLYSLAQSSNGIFHDVTAGDNIVPCASGSTGCKTGSFGYAAGPGYDLATGLGSVDAYNLVTKWAAAPAGVGTTTTLVASPASIASAASTQLTVTVKPVSGASAPTGSVNFSLAGATLGSVALVAASGTASATLTLKGSALAAGASSITATYTPAGGFSSSTASTTVTVTAPVAAATTTTLAASPASIAASASTQLTATVKAATGTPAGTVTFAMGSTALGSAPLSAGVATLSVLGTSLVAGANSITATFSATGSFASSTASATVTVTSPAVATTTTLAASPASIAPSASTQLTATVKAASGTPAGSVTFSTGGTTLGNATLASGIATLSLAGTKLSTGANTVTATYTPGSGFASSTASIAVTVTTPGVATTATATAAPASISQSASTVVAVSVKPASGSAAPTGTVTFSTGNTTLGTGNLSSGSASLTVKGSSLSAGGNTVTVTYAGAGGFAGSTANVTVTVSVPPVATTTSLAASPASLPQTGSTQLTATVTPAATGTINFTLAGKSLGSVALTSAGTAATAGLKISGTSLAMGSNTVNAAFVPSGNFGASTGTATVTVTAPLIATTTAIAASPASFAPTASTVLTVTVKPVSGSAVPAGNITFSAAGVTLGTPNLTTVAGVATATLTVKGSSLATGATQITAAFAGSATFAVSSATATVTVVQPAVATSISITAAPASMATSGSTQLTVTLKGATGGSAPTGTISFSAGTTALGSAPLVVAAGASGSTSTATLTVKGASLATGANTISAAYAGAAGFSGSNGTVQVTVAAAPVANVAFSAAKGGSVQQGFPVVLQIQETAGVATTLTGLSINGTNFSGQIAAFFGTTALPANGKLSVALVVQWNPLPGTLSFVVNGVDGAGHQWSQTATVATK